MGIEVFSGEGGQETGALTSSAKFAVIVCVAAACGSANPTAPDVSAPLTASTPYSWLSDQVVFWPSQPRTGDTLWVQDVVENVTDTTVVTSVLTPCMNVLGPGVTLEWDPYECIGGEGSLAPQEVDTAWGAIVITDPPGRYRVLFSHVVVPATWVHIPITICGTGADGRPDCSDTLPPKKRRPGAPQGGVGATIRHVARLPPPTRPLDPLPHRRSNFRLSLWR